MLVYVVRHGQSETNVSGIRAGQTDIKLAPQGYVDARRAGEKLKGIKFDRVFSSDLVRASETARTALPEMEPELRKEIREINIGRIAGFTNAECETMYGTLWTENFRIHNYVPFGGENVQQITDRVASFMRFLESLEKECSNVAVFAHGGSIRCIIRYVLGYPIDWWKLRTDNCHITVLELDNGFWRLRAFNV